jgi:RNA polymerase sigma-70 factor (ECF subfamily)
VPWLHAVPDELVTPDSQDPAAVAATRDSVRLALIAGLQELPARQRSVLLLREVLEIPATEVAVMLDTSVPAVKSALQRARARIAEVAPTPAGLVEPADPVARSLLDQYVAGFENADLAVLERALRADAAIEMVGSTTWFSGRETCLRYLARVLGAPGDWRMVRTSANGQPAAAAYLRGADGVRRAFGLGVLTATSSGISRIVVFADGADLLARFGQPADLGV